MRYPYDGQHETAPDAPHYGIQTRPCPLPLAPPARTSKVRGATSCRIWPYLALTPAKAGVGRCHRKFWQVSQIFLVGVGRCQAVWQKHMETHTQTQSTDLHVEENQAMFRKRKEIYLGVMDYGLHTDYLLRRESCL